MASEQQGFTCEVLFDESKLVVASFAKSGEPGGGSVLAGYWVVFEQPADLVEVVAAVRRAWWMSGTATFELNERTECQLAINDLFGVDYDGEVANVRMILGTHIGPQDEVVAEVRVVGSVWKAGQRQMTDTGKGILPFDADDVLIADALSVAMAASTGAGRG